jgi:putative Ca2+/H+ antiporter (TMEM165/GDT1 family)
VCFTLSYHELAADDGGFLFYLCRTFLIAAVLAMRHSRLLIFSAAISALGLMTILSAVLGQVVPSLISKRTTQVIVAVLFVLFGVRMWLDGMKMTGKEGMEELEEVEEELLDAKRKNDVEMGEMDDDTAAAASATTATTTTTTASDMNIKKSNKSDVSDTSTGSSGDMIDSIKNLMYFIFTPVFIQTFVMTFLAEWGDRSQLAS